MEKEAHRRTVEELEKLKEKVAELEAKARSYEVGAECDGEGVNRFGMLDDKVECTDDAMKEGIGEGEGGQTKAVACAEAEDVVEAESRTLPGPGHWRGRKKRRPIAKLSEVKDAVSRRVERMWNPAADRARKIYRVQCLLASVQCVW